MKNVYVLILITTIILIGGLLTYIHYNQKTFLVNTTQISKGDIEYITKPPSEFYGPTYIGKIPGLKIIVTLSNSSVKMCETLWMKVKLIGEKAYSVRLLRMTVMNSKGQKVYDTYIWLPHRTLTPGTGTFQEKVYNFAWKASKHPSANIDVLPGNYTFIIKAIVDEREIYVKGSIKVVEDSMEGHVKFKIFHGEVVDDSKESSGAYYVFVNLRSFERDFGRWLTYMALTKDFEWWVREFSIGAAKAAQRVKEVYRKVLVERNGTLVPIKPEELKEIILKEKYFPIYEWWFADLWKEVTGACIPTSFIEVMIGDKIYGVFSTSSYKCIEQYNKVLKLGGKFDLIVVWVSNELKLEQKDFETIPGWGSIYSLNSGVVRKLLKVIELSGFWDRIWLSLSILSVGSNVGSLSKHDNSSGVNVKVIVDELLNRFPNAVKIRLPPSNVDAIIFVKLTHLNEMLSSLKSKGVIVGVPLNYIVIF